MMQFQENQEQREDPTVGLRDEAVKSGDREIEV
jgi:hypothetical protein